MKKVVAVLAFLVAIAAYAQINGGPNGSGGGGVSQLLAGTGISLSPAGGTGNVTVTNTGAAPGFNNLTSGTNTSAAMVVGTGSSLESIPSLNVTQATAVNTTADGIQLYNTTPATSSSNFGYSPSIHFQGQDWTTQSGLSERVDMIWYMIPNVGFSSTAGTMNMAWSSNGGAYSAPNIGFTSAGLVTANNFAASSTTVPGSGSGLYQTASGLGLSYGGASVGSINTTNATFVGALASGGATFTYASGTGACATTSTLVGGAFAGSLTCTGTTGASTITLTLGAAAHAYSCTTRDITTGTDTGAQTGAASTTAVVLTYAAIAANDVIQFSCLAY